jgi:hypothetical protein
MTRSGQKPTTSMVLKGGAQGIPVPPGNPGFSGAAGQAKGAGLSFLVQAGYNAVRGVGQEVIELGITDAGPIVTPVAQLTTEDLGNIAYGAGLVKFGVDASTFFVGLWKGCQQ